MSARIGSAPVSYGVFGGSTPDVSPFELLAAMAEAGYAGSELGPPGFFGSPDATAAAFADHGLTVLGAYVPLSLAQPDDVLASDLDGMRRTLEELQAAGNPEALAILADGGDATLMRHPFRAPGERSLNQADWGRAAARLATAGELAASYGVRTTFHPHYATYVEQAGEIDMLLSVSDIGLCLDSGHFHLGGADPVEYVRRYADRINHVHVKDLHVSVVERARAERDEDLEAWWEDLCCPLGTGDVAIDAFVAELIATGYDGWFVVEQDRGPVTRETWTRTAHDQRHNHDYVDARLRVPR